MNTLDFIRTNIRWLLGGLILTIFASFGQTWFIAIYSSELRQLFSLSHGDFGALYMVGTLASAVTLVWLGRLADTIAVSHLAAAVCTALGVACLLMSQVSSVGMLLLVIFGLRLFGQGMMTHIAMVAMGRWYAAERGRAVSITSLGHQIGIGVLPIVTVSVMGWIGWRESWMLAAALLLAVALPAVFLLMKTERIPRGQLVLPVNSGVLRQWTRREVIADPVFWVLLTGVLAPAFIGTSVFFHQVHISEIKGWSRELIAGSIAVMSVATIVCSLLSGFLIDRYSARRLLPVFLLPMGIGSVLLGLLHESNTMIVFMLLYGMSAGFSTALFGSVWPEVYGTRHLGAVRSMIMAAMVIASALGPGVTGWLIDLGVGFESQLVTMGVYCLIGAFVMAWASQILVRRTLMAVEG